MKKQIHIQKKKCRRCNHEWFPRKTERPVVCPKCHSPYWEKEAAKKKEAA